MLRLTVESADSLDVLSFTMLCKLNDVKCICKIAFYMFALSFLCLVSQNFNPLPFLYFSFVCEIRFITKTKYVSFVFTMPDCHLTIITPMQWIKVDHVLWSDSWGTLHWRNAFNARPNKICAANFLVNPMENKSQNKNWKYVQMKTRCRPDDSVNVLRAPCRYSPT